MLYLRIQKMLLGTAACLLFIPVLQATQLTSEQPLSLEAALSLAQSNDAWLAGSRLQQQALIAQSESASTLPAPTINMGLANLPVDTFAFDQEGMTQFKVGIAQQFPRGDSRALEQQRLALLSEQQPALRADRTAKLNITVTTLWLEAYLANESIRLIEQDRSLFEYLVEVAQSSYATALGSSRQQDIIRAQLELTRLEDRLATLEQQRETAMGKLGQWLGPVYPHGESVQWQTATSSARVEIAHEMPELALSEAEVLLNDAVLSDAFVSRYLLAHPRVTGIDKRILSEQSRVDIARQKYKPQWGLNASYGYRDDDPMGASRADFFSVGVSFDLPLFTDNRQDKDVQAAMSRTESMRTEKWLLLREMRAEWNAQRAKLQRLNQRSELYEQRLLLQMHDQAEASLSAYTSDDGDFSEVVRARISELNAKIDALGIQVEKVKTIANLNYFLIGASAEQLESEGGAL